MKEELIMKRFETQIEKLMDTMIEIEKFEEKKPLRELTDWHQVWLSMLFFNQVLMKSMYKELKDKITGEERLQYIEEVAEMTKSHYRNLYYFDTTKLWTNKQDKTS